MLTPEELEQYKAKCEEVARKLYSLNKIHYTRWEDASPNVRDHWLQVAHMSRVWWNIETGNFFLPRVDRPKEEG